DEQNRTNRRELQLVSDLIDNSSRKWRSDLINSTFQEDTAQKILQIPLAETEHKDTQVWKGELSSEFSLPSKIAIIIWWIPLDYIPHLANLRFKRVTSNDCCPRCGFGVEESLHVFRECPFTREVWQSLNLTWVMDNTIQNIWEWLTWEGVPRITIQFDVALDSRTFKSATGLVGWDMRGNLLVLKTIIHRNVPSPFATEAYACLEGIKLGIALRTQSVRIMGDSKTVIKKSQATSTDKSMIGAIIRDIQNKKSCFQELTFQHIHRSENTHAHSLAKKALVKEESTYLIGEELERHVLG
ncbi:hypothetical protein Goari_022990, partial [Gossypium aridum]|nr:hypothetical protein [Gossypium aridum]